MGNMVELSQAVALVSIQLHGEVKDYFDKAMKNMIPSIVHQAEQYAVPLYKQPDARQAQIQAIYYDYSINEKLLEIKQLVTWYMYRQWFSQETIDRVNDVLTEYPNLEDRMTGSQEYQLKLKEEQDMAKDGVYNIRRTLSEVYEKAVQDRQERIKPKLFPS